MFSNFSTQLQRESLLNTSPRACWDDFDFCESENDLPELPKRTISDGSTPWNDFKSILIGQR